jgi:hypothetical protein
MLLLWGCNHIIFLGTNLDFRWRQVILLTGIAGEFELVRHSSLRDTRVTVMWCVCFLRICIKLSSCFITMKCLAKSAVSETHTSNAVLTGFTGWGALSWTFWRNSKPLVVAHIGDTFCACVVFAKCVKGTHRVMGGSCLTVCSCGFLVSEISEWISIKFHILRVHTKLSCELYIGFISVQRMITRTLHFYIKLLSNLVNFLKNDS